MRPTPLPIEPGQESVWDYPRPAILEDTAKHLKIICQGIVLAETHQGKRVLETSHPPTYYFPAEDIQLAYLIETSRTGFCEWKGRYRYYDIQIGEQIIHFGAWRHYQATPAFASIETYYGFFPGLMDACYVDAEQVIPQEGDFYGGWITSDIVGPFKGGPGTWGW